MKKDDRVREARSEMIYNVFRHSLKGEPEEKVAGLARKAQRRISPLGDGIVADANLTALAECGPGHPPGRSA